MLHMASVRMSDRLRGELEQSIEEKFLIADPKPTMDSSLAQVILDAMLHHKAYQKATAFLADPDIKAMAANKYASTLSNYLNSFRQTKVVRRIDVKGFKFNNVEQDFKISLPIPATMHFANAYGEFMEVHLDDFDAAAKTKLEAEMTLKAKELLDWTTRHETYMTSMKGLLKNCNTVGQFLGALPGAEALLKPDVVQKLNEKHVSTKDQAAADARAAFDALTVAPTLLAAEIISAAGVNTTPDNT